MQSQDIVVLFASALILFGVVKLIFINTRDPNNVSLTRWMLTGGLVELMVGVTLGVINLLRLQFDDNAKAVLIIMIGVLLNYLALS